MGIAGLETHLLRHRDLGATSTRALRHAASPPLVLLVDGPSLHFHLLASAEASAPDAPFPALFSGGFHALRQHVLTFVAAFRLAGVALEVVNDSYGGHDAARAKARTSAARFAQRIAQAHDVERFLESGALPRSSPGKARRERVEGGVGAVSSPSPAAHAALLTVPKSCLSTLQVNASLEEAGVPLTSVYGEADAALARAVASSPPTLCIGVCAQDTDYAAYFNCRYVPLDSIVIPPALFARASAAVVASLAAGRGGDIPLFEGTAGEDGSDEMRGSERESIGDIALRVITPLAVATSVSIPVRLMPDLAALAGNDYTAHAWLDALNTLPLSLHELVQHRVRFTDAAAWCARELCVCDIDEGCAAGLCATCARPVCLEAHALLAPILLAHSELAAALAFSRTTYSLEERTIEDCIESAAFGGGAFSTAPTASSAAPLSVRLCGDDRSVSCSWTRSVYAGDVLGLLQNVELLEERVDTHHPALEPVAFREGTPTSTLATFPFDSVLQAWASNVDVDSSSADAGPLHPNTAIAHSVPFGLEPAFVDICPHPDARFRAALLDAGSSAGFRSASTATSPHHVPTLLDVCGSAMPLLGPQERWALFSTAASVSLCAWTDAWFAHPRKVNANASPSSASSVIASPWLVANFVVSDFSAAVTAGLSPEHTQYVTGALELVSRSVSHIIAITSHVQRHEGLRRQHALQPVLHTPAAAALPSLQELSALLATAAILIAAEAVPTTAGAALLSNASSILDLPPLDRPRMRTCAAATWFQRSLRGVRDIGRATAIIPPSGAAFSARDSERRKLSPPITPTLRTRCFAPGADDFLVALVRLAGAWDATPSSDARVASIARLITTPPPLALTSVEPRHAYDGRMFHSFAQSLGQWGFDQGGGAPATTFTQDGHLDAFSMLTTTSRQALSRADAALGGPDGALLPSAIYRGLWQAALAPFDHARVFHGYALTYGCITGGGLPVAVPLFPPAVVQSEVGVAPTMDENIAIMMSLFASMSSGGGKTTATPPAGEGGHTAVLPILEHRASVVWTVAQHTVTIIKGDTGSGKSSQVPQFLLDQSLCTLAAAQKVRYKGTWPIEVPPEVWGDYPANVYVTQPRRVAAVTLAKRVAEERGEAIAKTVGYRIGQDAAAGRETRITFVTTGWMLTWLVGASVKSSQGEGDNEREEEHDVHPDSVAADIGGSQPVTHMVLDEVHERAVDCDLVCLVVKLALTRGIAARASAMQQLQKWATEAGGTRAPPATLEAFALQALRVYARRTRLILMSATIDTGVFTDYLSRVAVEHAERLEGELRAGRTSARDVHDACVLKWSLPHTLRAPHDVVLAMAASATAAAASGAGATPLVSASVLKRGAAAMLPPSSAPRPPPTTLLELIHSDVPATMFVGAKRYPVDVVHLEDIYAHSTTRDMAQLEAGDVAIAVNAFNGAAASWTNGGGHSGGRSGACGATGAPAPAQRQSSVNDALMLNDRASNGLMRLAARLAVTIARPGTGDAILIFVPGMADIEALIEVFKEVAPGLVAAPTARLALGEEVAEDTDLQTVTDAQGRLTSKGLGASSSAAAVLPTEEDANAPSTAMIRLLPMHSLIAFDDQMAAFDGADPRTRVVLATNIAESSITVPGVTAVIDMGRAKQIEYDVKLRTSLLRLTWTSQASAKQRQGRAGRVMPGVCYRLYTRPFFERVMPPYDLPEMLRLNLEAVVLKVKMLGIRTDAATAAAVGSGHPDPLSAPLSGITVNSAKAVLAMSLQTPDMTAVDAALQRLASLGALNDSDDNAEVTAFGRVLAAFPSDVALGRLVAFGATFGCLPDAIVMAACAAVGDVFLMPHSAVSASPEDYAGTVLKVTRARWLFGRDATLAAASGGTDTTGASLHAFSDLITARNAYIAWRCVLPPTRRPVWSSGLGIMHKRMVAVHATVQEIGMRMSNDTPLLKTTILTLLHGSAKVQGEGGGSAEAGGNGEASPAGGSGRAPWPPAGLFTPNTHVLRLAIVAAFCPNLAVANGAVRPHVASPLLTLTLDPQRSLMADASKIPRAWHMTNALTRAASCTPRASGNRRDAVAPEGCARVLCGDLARGLHALGVSPHSISKLSHDAPSGICGIELEGDWEADAALLVSAKYDAPRWRNRGGDIPAPPGGFFSSPISDTVLPLLGLTPLPRGVASDLRSAIPPSLNRVIAPPEPSLTPGQVVARKAGGVTTLRAAFKVTGAQTAVVSDADTTAVGAADVNHFCPPFNLRIWPRSALHSHGGGEGGGDDKPPEEGSVDEGAEGDPTELAGRPFALALPVASLALLFVAGQSSSISLPHTQHDNAAAAELARTTGERVHVPGMVYGDASGGMGQHGWTPLPLHSLQGVGEPPKLPSLSSVQSAYNLSWRLSTVVSGKRAFASLSPHAQYVPGDEFVFTGFQARVPQASILKLIADVVPRVDAEDVAAYDDARAKAALLPRIAVSSSRHAHRRSPEEALREELATTVCGATFSAPLLAVVPSFALSQSMTPGKRTPGPIIATFVAPTLLWRDVDAQALSLLLFSRGVEVMLHWNVTPAWEAEEMEGYGGGHGGGQMGVHALVTSVDFDPRGPTPLTLHDTSITLRQLHEVGLIRAHISEGVVASTTPRTAPSRGAIAHSRRGGAAAAPAARSCAFLGPPDEVQARTLALLGLTVRPPHLRETLIECPAAARFKCHRRGGHASKVLLQDFGGQGGMAALLPPYFSAQALKVSKVGAEDTPVGGWWGCPVGHPRCEEEGEEEGEEGEEEEEEGEEEDTSSVDEISLPRQAMGKPQLAQGGINSSAIPVLHCSEHPGGVSQCRSSHDAVVRSCAAAESKALSAARHVSAAARDLSRSLAAGVVGSTLRKQLLSVVSSSVKHDMRQSVAVQSSAAVVLARHHVIAQETGFVDSNAVAARKRCDMYVKAKAHAKARAKSVRKALQAAPHWGGGEGGSIEAVFEHVRGLLSRSKVAVSLDVILREAAAVAASAAVSVGEDEDAAGGTSDGST